MKTYLQCLKFLTKHEFNQESIKNILVEEDLEGTTLVATNCFSMGIIKIKDRTKEKISSYLLKSDFTLSEEDAESFPKWRMLLPEETYFVNSYSKKDLLNFVNSYKEFVFFITENKVYKFDKKKVTKLIKSLFAGNDFIKVYLTDHSCVMFVSDKESYSKTGLLASLRK